VPRSLRSPAPLILACLLAGACDGTPREPIADGCAFAADPGSCWRSLAAEILACMAASKPTIQAELSSDGLKCTSFQGPYADFVSALPVGIDASYADVTIGFGSEECARIVRNRAAGTLELSMPDGRTLRERFDSETRTSEITCPDLSVHVITNDEVTSTCFAEAMGGGIPSVLMDRNTDGLTIALSGYEGPLIVCKE